MSKRYSIIRHWDILISGFINTVHYIFAIKHKGTALDNQIIFSKVIRKICSAYQTYIQFLSKTFFEHSQELKWYRYFKEKNTPVVPVLNKTDLYTQEEKEKLAHLIQRNTKDEVCLISAKTGEGIRNLKELLARSIPEGYGNRMITGDLVDTGDLVLLVMPKDIQAPKGRLI